IRQNKDYNQEFRCRCADGSVRWIHEDVHVESAGPGRWRLVGVCVDVTELKNAHLLLEKAKVELERSNNELQNFAFVASHDLKEPLRKILAFGQLLTEEHSDALPAEGHEYLQEMCSAAGRMQSLIESLLMLCRVSTR